VAIVLNAEFHEKMREVLAPFVVADEGLMQKNKDQDGGFRLTPVKGVARMEWCVMPCACPPLVHPPSAFLTIHSPAPSLPSAHIFSKRLTDHNDAHGCRPALNIDVMRIIGVCKTVVQMKAALQKLGKTFKGCGRVKVRPAAALNLSLCWSLTPHPPLTLLLPQCGLLERLLQ
jgi:hypothetical protein